MANEFVAKNGLISQNNSIITGSLTVTTGITGSLVGTASWATNASTSSTILVTNDAAPTARYVPFVANSGSGAASITNRLLTNGNFSYTPTSNTLSVTSSWATNALTASFLNNGTQYAGVGSIITGSIAISASYGLLVPANTFTVGDIIKIQGVFIKPTSATSTQYYIYANTSNQLSGATQMANYNSATTRWTPITRTFGIESSTRTVGYAAATSHYADDVAIATGFNTSSLNIDWTVNQYIIFAAQNATLGDRTDALRFYAKII
jgi:hypothetical protein